MNIATMFLMIFVYIIIFKANVLIELMHVRVRVVKM